MSPPAVNSPWIGNVWCMKWRRQRDSQISLVSGGKRCSQGWCRNNRVSHRLTTCAPQPRTRRLGLNRHMGLGTTCARVGALVFPSTAVCASFHGNQNGIDKSMEQSKQSFENQCKGNRVCISPYCHQGIWDIKQLSEHIQSSLSRSNKHHTWSITLWWLQLHGSRVSPIAKTVNNPPRFTSPLCSLIPVHAPLHYDHESHLTASDILSTKPSSRITLSNV